MYFNLTTKYAIITKNNNPEHITKTTIKSDIISKVEP
jgi:hypothetical protein